MAPESELLCRSWGYSDLAVNRDVAKKAFGGTIQPVKSFSNAQKNFIGVPAFLRRHIPHSDKAASNVEFFLLLHASSYLINRSTSWVTLNLLNNCHRLLGSRAIPMEKQEIIRDLPADLPAEDSDFETLTIAHNKQAWPKDWRAYTACFAGFCGMALCW